MTLIRNARSRGVDFQPSARKSSLSHLGLGSFANITAKIVFSFLHFRLLAAFSPGRRAPDSTQVIARVANPSSPMAVGLFGAHHGST